ncbi:MAG: hypothetical protein MUO99_07045 [Dehalococcoidales bacterium]|nr:hypothetical protein [Dehalococcoidales bacterium]
MRTHLPYIFLSLGIGIAVKAYALPIVLRIVAIRDWIYRALPSQEGKVHSEDMLANLPDEIAYYRLQGDSNEVIAARILLRLVSGLPGDLAIWAFPLLALFVGKIARWSDTLRRYKIPSAMVAGVGTLALMNYSLFSSQSNPATGTWLLANGTVIAITVLIWKRNHPLARRIFNIWMGMAIAASLGFMVWLTINYRLHEITTFKVFMLAMLAASPAIIVADESWRKRVFGRKWWLIVICWAGILAGVSVGSLLIAHDVKLLLVTWAVMALLVAGLFTVGGVAALAGYVLCWLGIRGGAGGLRLLASGIRRLR